MHKFKPQSLDPSSLKYGDKIACITDLIYTAPVYNRDLRDRQLIPLQKQQLRERFGRIDLDSAINEAVDSGIIYVDPSYQPEKYSKGYSIGTSYWADDVDEWEVTNKYILNKEREFWQRRTTDNRANWESIHYKLWADLQTITIDDLSKQELMFYAEYDHTNYIQNLISYNKVRRGKWFLTVCPYKRVHTNITNIQSGMRAHLKINNERLVKLDIKNCQPLLMTKLIEKYVSAPNKSSLKVYPGEIQDGGGFSFYYVGNRVDGEIQKYVSACESGTLYELAMEYTKKDRRTTKDEMLVYLYSHTNYDCAIKTFFQMEFPTIYKMIVDVKQFDYTLLAHELQTMEANLMINTICSRFKGLYPDVPIISIHDCLCVPQSFDKELLRNLITAAFNELGLNPAIDEDK